MFAGGKKYHPINPATIMGRTCPSVVGDTKATMAVRMASVARSRSGQSVRAIPQTARATTGTATSFSPCNQPAPLAAPTSPRPYANAIKASADPKDKGAVAKALSTLKTDTMIGKVDFTSGPVANVSPGPIIGTQWVPAKEGSKFKLDYVVTENATDPNVPVAAKLLPYNV